MYVLSYFRTEAEALHLAISTDGLWWQALNNNQPIFHSSIGTRSIRDPFIFQTHDGQFHLLATNGWEAESILHAVSEDLITWHDEMVVPVMHGVAGVRNCWAPECFRDHARQCYRLIWSSSIAAPTGHDDWNHRIWSTTTTDWATYTPARLFFDPGYSVIDAAVVAHDGEYLMAFKDERGENRVGTAGKAIGVWMAPDALGPWMQISALITPPLTEGPALFRRDNTWVMLFDHFMEGFFGAMESQDGRSWLLITDRLQMPSNPRHASVLTIDDAQAEQLLRRLA